MNNHRYILNKGSKKFICPECNQKRFVRYIDIETNSYLPDNIGRCDRESSCGCWNKPKIETAENQPVNYYFVPFDKLINYSSKAYKITTANGLFYLPKATVYEIAVNGCYVAEWFLKENGSNKKPVHLSNDFKSVMDGEAVTPAKRINTPGTTPKPILFIDPALFKDSLGNYESNHFVQYLISLFGNDVAAQLVGKYFIGSSNHWQGANIFWQIDTDRNIRTGKIMLYSPTTGKRNKEPYNYIDWVHTAIKRPDFEVIQCLFGSHLLRDKTKPVALCESEKTAIIASVYFPKFIWVATGGADGLSTAKCDTLNRHGKPVVLFPDISVPKEGKQSTFEKWQGIASKYLLKYNFSTLLESKASEADKAKGLDLADYLTQFDYSKFITPDPQPKVLAPLIKDAPVTHFKAQQAPVQLKRSANRPWVNNVSDSTQYTLDQLIEMARRDKAKIIRVPSEKYFKAWAQSMNGLLLQSGVTQQQFLNSIL